MHIFLQGPKRIGKSTVINKTLDMLKSGAQIRLGGFFTWNGGKSDPHVYIRSAFEGSENKAYRLASYDLAKGGLISDINVFEQEGVRFLSDCARANLIIMDELGFLENNAPLFKQAVLDTLNGDIPVLGVLRLGDVEWHEGIKNSPQVTIYDVDEKNRDILPRELAEVIKKATKH